MAPFCVDSLVLRAAASFIDLHGVVAERHCEFSVRVFFQCKSGTACFSCDIRQCCVNPRVCVLERELTVRALHKLRVSDFGRLS